MRKTKSAHNLDVSGVKRIHKYGSPALRKKARLLREVGKRERAIFYKMLELMYKHGGIGLAAPQVGLDLQMIVIDIGECPVMLTNPKVLKRQGTEVMEEGCLSLPDVTVNIKRAKKIFVEAISQDNKKIKFHADELLARAILHEMDHLRGKLIVDYAGLAGKLRLKKKLKEISKREKDERLCK